MACLIISLLLAESFAVDRGRRPAGIDLTPPTPMASKRTVRPHCCAAVRPASASAAGGSHSSKCIAERSMTRAETSEPHWTQARGQSRPRRHARANGPRVNLFGAWCNLFIFLDAHRPWRHVKATDQRTARDFANCVRDLVDTHYPDVAQLRVVMDTLSTHTAGALYETFAAPEAHRILQRL